MTVFVRSDTLIAVQGTGIEGADDVRDRVLDWMGTPPQRSHEVTNSGELEAQGKLKASTGIFGLAKAETEGGGELAVSHSRDICYLQEEGLSQIVEEFPTARSAHFRHQKLSRRLYVLASTYSSLG